MTSPLPTVVPRRLAITGALLVFIMAAFLRLVFLSAVLSAVAAVCPLGGWQLYRDQCYWASSFPIEWRSVANVCSLEFPGARPVSVHDMQLNAFLAEHVLNFTGGWLGLRRKDESHGWKWSDGSPFDWENWEEGQPHGDGERCAYIQEGERGEWRDGDCDISYLRFVCQTQDRPTTITEGPTTDMTSTWYYEG